MTFNESYDYLYRKLEATMPREDCGMVASVLFEEVYNVDRFHLHLDSVGTREVDLMSERRLETMAQRVLAGEPVQYVCGHWGFFGLDFVVDEGVLIPRPDTELLVEAALERIPKGSAVVYDLCAGTGCVGIAINANHSFAKVYAVEKSAEAYRILTLNCSLYGDDITAIHGDVLRLRQPLPLADVIVCNPPYLDAADMASLSPVVRYEPEAALYGGEDGLLFYREIPRLYGNKLRQNGWLLFEVGYRQGETVAALLKDYGFVDVEIRRDFGGNQRVVMGRKP